MPKYVMLTKLTDEGAKTIGTHPHRIVEVDQEMEAFGLKVIYRLAVLGEYDFVNVVEAPDNVAIAKASIELGKRGTLRVQTLPAIEMDVFTAALG